MSTRPQLNIRCTQSFLDALAAKALAERRTVSDWARLLLADAAGIGLPKAKKATRTTAKNGRPTNNRPAASRQR
jgi:hypothetical protein